MIEIGGFEVSWWLIILLVILAIALTILVVDLSIKAHRLQITAGREELIGRTAEVKEALSPRGVVFVEGERWSAISEGGRAEPGEEVIITRVDGLKLYVTKKEKGGK